jgi:hypothetical protein
LSTASLDALSPSPWPTPRRLRARLLLIWAAGAVLLLVGEGAIARVRHANRTIGKDAAPSIIAAQEIGSALADLDASAANYLLLVASGSMSSATDVFEARRTQATRRMLDVAEDITYGDAERIPILTLFDGFGRYLELVAQARWLHDHGQPGPALNYYRDATALMHATLLPAANALDEANRSQMDAIYGETRRMRR